MSHYITVPIDANGVIDPDERLQEIVAQEMSSAFSVTDIFIYSHGWWTTADAALKNYNVATTGFIYFARNKGFPKGEPPMFPPGEAIAGHCRSHCLSHEPSEPL